MASNILLKQGFVTGVVATVCCVMLTISKILTVHKIVSSEYYSKDAQVEEVIIMIVALVVTLFSILMIWGVIKKRCRLVAPLLVAAILSSCYLTFTMFYNALTSKYFSFDDYLYGVLTMGGAIIAIYPMCQLFLHLHHLNAAHRTLYDSK